MKRTGRRQDPDRPAGPQGGHHGDGAPLSGYQLLEQTVGKLEGGLVESWWAPVQAATTRLGAQGRPPAGAGDGWAGSG